MAEKHGSVPDIFDSITLQHWKLNFNLIHKTETAELQIRRGIEDNSKIIFLFLKENICCDPS